MVMTRAGHLAWARERAMESINSGDSARDVWASFVVDTCKHVGTIIDIKLVTMTLDLLRRGYLGDPEDMRHHINRF